MASESVEQIFLEVVERPPAERGALLDERCGGDVQLKSRVLRLLQADQDHGDATDAMTNPAPVAARFANADPVPARVGGYAIRDVVGEGGMGAVYDALHEPTGRRAAVKLIRAGIATGPQRERFRIEAETLGRLNDPGIAQLYDAGLAEVAWPGGAAARRPFIAMEFVEGATGCVEFARQRKLSTRDCVALVERVARAVHHAHQRGVIHRDLKPGNVLVTADGKPKVVDFGIARLLDATAADGITITGQILGTVRYMSPEQAGGDPRQVDTRADIYSIGAILYEMLAGRPVIELDGGSSFGAAVQMLTAASPPRLPTIRPDCAGDLAAIVHKAIERDANDRYGSALGLADDLSRYLDGREVSARAPRTIERFVRVVKRNKGKFAAIAVIVLLLIGGIIGTTWGLVRADRQRQIAEANEAKAVDAEEDTAAYGEFLGNRVLAAARPKGVQRGLGIDVSVVQALEEAEKHLDEDFNGRPRAEALARHEIGVTWRNLGRLESAEKQLRRAVELREKSLGPDDPQTLYSRNSLAAVLYSMARYDEGIPFVQQTLAKQKAVLGPDHPNTLHSMQNLGAFYFRSGRNAEALTLLQDVLARQQRTVGRDSPETLETLGKLVSVYTELGRLDEALPVAREACDRLSATLGADHPETMKAASALALLWLARDEPAKAVPLLERVVDSHGKTFGPDHELTAFAKGNLSGAYLESGQLDKSVAMFGQFIDSMRKVYGARSPRFTGALVNVSNALLEHQRPDAAERHLRECVEVRQQVMPGSASLFEAQCLLGESLAAQGKSDEALSLLTTGTEGLEHQPTLSPALEARRQSAGHALIVLLDARGQKNPAQVWRERLATSRPATQPATSRR